MGKYDRWEQFFRALEGEHHEIPLDVLEEYVDGDLPPTALRYKAWWAGEHYYAWWRRAGWYASLQPQEATVVFTRTPSQRGRPKGSAPPRSTRAGAARPSPVEVPSGPRIVLLGCVGQKGPSPAPARDLYVSALWRKRLRYAESTGMTWFVLSAEHGLLDPDELIAPYDRPMADEDRAYREEWSRRVAGDVLARCRADGLEAVEVHAGAAYLEHGLIAALNRSGITVVWPLRGRPIGEQLSWYDRVAAGEAGLSDTGASAPAVRRSTVEPSAAHAEGVAEVYRSGVLGESWADLPEVWSLPSADGQATRFWITFVAAVNRARDATSLWQSAHRAWADDVWVFRPVEVVSRPFVELAEALRRHGLSRRHLPDAGSWRSIAEALHSSECPEPVRRAIEGDPCKAAEVLDALDTTWRHGTRMFPQLSGPKIGPMWVRMLVYPGGAAISGLDVIPVAVDTHVQRVTEMLGLVEPRSLDDAHRRRIQQAWFEAVADAGPFGAPAEIDGTAAGLDPALWVLGRNGCSRCEQSGGKVPVGPICEICVLGRV